MGGSQVSLDPFPDGSDKVDAHEDSHGLPDILVPRLVLFDQPVEGNEAIVDPVELK